jgi:hypothetical protein
MEFDIGDRVRVAKSAAPDYIGVEGVVVARQRASDPIFNSYTLKTDGDGTYDFLEFQLEAVRRFGTTAGGP